MKANPTQMIVTWVTKDETPVPTVEYGLNGLEQQAFGESSLFIDGGFEKRRMQIHRVILENLKPGQKYSKLYIHLLMNKKLFLIIIQNSVSLRQL
jgi:hypothetical protein